MRSAKNPLIEAVRLDRSYGTAPAVHALVDATFKVEQGEWVAIIGPSGSGKSTLLNILGGLDLQTSGTYLFDGVDVAKLSDKERAGLRSRGIGFVFQAFHLLSHRTVLENVMLSEIYRDETSAGRRDRAATALRKVGLSHRADFLPTKLSGGERQRAAIARALTGSPRLVLCDEPTGNLDSTNTAAILDLIDELHAEGVTIVTITHEHDVARRAGRQLHMVDGHLKEVA